MRSYERVDNLPDYTLVNELKIKQIAIKGKEEALKAGMAMDVPADNQWVHPVIGAIMYQKKNLLGEIDEIQEEITKRVDAGIWNPKSRRKDEPNI